MLIFLVKLIGFVAKWQQKLRFPVKIRMRPFMNFQTLCVVLHFHKKNSLSCCKVETCCILLRLSLLDFSALSSPNAAISRSTLAIYEKGLLRNNFFTIRPNLPHLQALLLVAFCCLVNIHCRNPLSSFWDCPPERDKNGPKLDEFLTSLRILQAQFGNRAWKWKCSSYAKIEDLK